MSYSLSSSCALVCLLASLPAACRGTSRSEADNVIPAPSAIGRPTAISRIRSITGPELSHLARANRDTGTLFNIWASWCGSCKGELPMLHQLANEYAARGLHVVVVSVDEPEDLPRLPGILAGYGFTSAVWVAARPLSDFKWALAQNWKGNIPVTFLYDARGKRRYFWDGPVEEAELRPVIEQFFSGRDVQGEKHFALSAGITDEPSAQPAHE